MRRWQQVAVAGSAVLALGAMAAGGAVTEDPDAGDLPATAMPVGAAAVVDGSLSATTDADVYRVCAGDGGLTASTVGGTSIDTVLYLFDRDGRALAMNDDARGTWQSEITHAGGAGEYLVAVSAFGHSPASTGGTAMFTSRGAVTSPDAVLGAWREFHPATGAYRLALTGAVECDEPAAEGPLVASLDVLPGSPDTTISSRARGRTPMALLSVDGVDVSGLAGAAIEVGPAGASPVKVQVADVDSDGVGDLLVHAHTPELGLSPGTVDLCVTVTPEEGPVVQGCETVSVR